MSEFPYVIGIGNTLHGIPSGHSVKQQYVTHMFVNCVFFFVIAHFNECQKKRAGVKGVRTLENFFAKAAAQRLPEPTSSILPVSNEDEQDQFDGADAIVSEK